jgi:trans-2,3-dihydro-3-hydroxyanthranilate isomerase
MSLKYRHVDVFSSRPYSGNSLTVFLDSGGLTAAQMLRITQELRHFESIFLEPTAKADKVRARVFDLFEELPFAGHPVIGAAAVLHHVGGPGDRCTWAVQLTDKEVSIVTERTATGYFGVLDQGTPEIFGSPRDCTWVAPAFGLEKFDLHPELPLEVISTGLRYLIVPVIPGALARAHISRDISALLKTANAQFAVLLDESSVEVRHWNNDGIIEDVATGSAAGTIGAYRLRHGLTPAGETFILNQGRFAGRPSTLRIQPEGTARKVENVKVGGDVVLVGRGTLHVQP